MRRILIGAVAAGTLVAPALAADLGAGVEVVEPPAYVAEAFNWTGFYAGVMGGFGGDEFNYPFSGDLDPPEFSGQVDITSSGFFAGGQIGGNWQINNMMVLGAVADIAWADIDGELSASLDTPVSGEISAGSTVEWFGTVRGKVGFLPTPRLQIYGTGGFAYGSVDHHYDLTDLFGPGASDSTSATQTGWTAGGGFEYAVTDRVTLFTEYLYVDLGDENLFSGDLGPVDNFSIDAETQFHTIKAGINILLN